MSARSDEIARNRKALHDIWWVANSTLQGGRDEDVALRDILNIVARTDPAAVVAARAAVACPGETQR